jgi:methionine-rich copper-binding protein CopC
MKRKVQFLGWFVALTAATGVFATVSWSTVHLSLVKSEPSADQHVTDTLSTIRLWFNQEPDKARSNIRMEGPHGGVEMGPTKGNDDPRSVVAEVKGSLSEGEYMVKWEAAGADGDAVRGRYKFFVEAPHR